MLISPYVTWLNLKAVPLLFLFAGKPKPAYPAPFASAFAED
jgi:hypothetical protein